MWHWDQGRLEYFQFDALRQISAYVIKSDFRTADRLALSQKTGLKFAVPPSHTPWRNYSRVLKLMLLISEEGDIAKATPVAIMLSTPGTVTCDEYLHFIICAFTEPSPALADWTPNADFRYPLLFALKYLLAKTVITDAPVASLTEIIGAYAKNRFSGDEDQEKFISIIGPDLEYENIDSTVPASLLRQAKESLKVIAQVSYLHMHNDRIFVSLSPIDAQEIFDDIQPITGPRANERNAEIRRLASLFKGGSTSIAFEFPNTIIETVVESGFREGNKIKRPHVIIERNAGLRRQYFTINATAVCDMCRLDTKKTYSWTERVLDVHHLLPLSSGTRVEGHNTTFNDLVPICPNCHRAVHRYYDNWLDINNRKDFMNGDEAKRVYHEIKTEFGGLMYGNKSG